MSDLFLRARQIIDELVKIGKMNDFNEEMRIVELEEDFLDGLQKIVVKIGKDTFSIDVPTREVKKL